MGKFLDFLDYPVPRVEKFQTYAINLNSSNNVPALLSRIVRAKKIIKSGAKTNGVKLSDERIDELIATSHGKESMQEEEGEGEEDVNTLSLVKVLQCRKRICYYHLSMKTSFQNSCLLQRFAIMIVNWIAVVLCYNGLTLNNVNLGGSVHLNMAIGVLVEIPSYLFCVVTVDK